MSGYETACVECGETLPPYARSCRCGWKAAVKPKPAASTNCACGRFGITKRDGAWLCGICAGVPPRAVGGHVSWREQWYADHGLPYEPERVGNMDLLANRVVAMREPGED